MSEQFEHESAPHPHIAETAPIQPPAELGEFIAATALIDAPEHPIPSQLSRLSGYVEQERAKRAIAQPAVAEVSYQQPSLPQRAVRGTKRYVSALAETILSGSPPTPRLPQ